MMFCDLVDSTGIAARLDAEEWRDASIPCSPRSSAGTRDLTNMRYCLYQSSH